MARKSNESLSIVPVRALPSRIEPPSDLTAAQAELWRATVATKPIDWFAADSAPLLAEYVRAVAMCNALAGRIDASLSGDDAGAIKPLLDMRDKESRRVASLATKLRLTNQSRYTPQAANTASKRSAQGGKLWQFGRNS